MVFLLKTNKPGSVGLTHSTAMARLRNLNIYDQLLFSLFVSLHSLKKFERWCVGLQTVVLLQLRKEGLCNYGWVEIVSQVAGFDSPYVLEMKERNLVCRANRLLLVKCYGNRKVKSPHNWVIYPLTQPQMANQQKNKPGPCLNGIHW